MDLSEFINKASFPIFFTFLYVILYLLRKRVFKLIKKYVKDKEILNIIKLLAFNFRFKIENLQLTIVIPMVLTVILDVLIVWIFQASMKPYDEPLWFQLTVRSFLNPISEEVVMRGFIFGCFFLTTPGLIIKLLKNRKFIKFSFPFHKLWVILMLLLQAYLFAICHENPTLFNWSIRLSSGLLYGLLYLVYKRNLLPSITAHITHNLLITLANL